MVTVWELLAIWNMLGKLAATPDPMFVTCAENDSCCPTVPEEGVAVVAPAVRSGYFDSEHDAVVPPPEPTQDQVQVEVLSLLFELVPAEQE